MSSNTKLQICNLALSLIGARNITLAELTTPSTEESKRIYATYPYILDEVLMEHSWSFSQKRASLVEMTRTEVDDWVTATAYVVDDRILAADGLYYDCLIAHTSGVFATDLAAGDWVLVTDWVTGTAYTIGEKVYDTGIEYSCLVNHTAAALFATDLASVYWVATELITNMDDRMTSVFYLPTDFIRLTRLSDEDAAYEMLGIRLLADTETLSIKYTYRNETPTTYSPYFVTALSTRLAAEICFNIVQSATKAADILKKYEQVDLYRAMSADSSMGSPEETRPSEWVEARNA